MHAQKTSKLYHCRPFHKGSIGDSRIVDDGMSEHIMGQSYNTGANGTDTFASRDLMQSGMEMAQRVRDMFHCICLFSCFSVYVEGGGLWF